MVLLLTCALLAVAALDLALAARALALAAAAAVPPPPELAPLLQKTSELQISSERFSGESTITGKKLPVKLKALGGLKMKIAGELSISPEAASITETLAGKTISLRLVDNTLYIHDATIAKHDGGRPWVKESESQAGGVFGSHPTLGGGNAGGSGGPAGSGGSVGSAGASTAGAFKTETALLKASPDVRSLGASTIDGQAVSGFAGTADPTEIEQSTLSAKLREQLRKSHIAAASSFEIFLAANGLPVRSNIVLALGGVKLNVTDDVLAINFPVAAIPAPPAAETITAAELKRLLVKKTKSREKK
jgi:hypothetical protein